jgi:hypothetical protein
MKAAIVEYSLSGKWLELLKEIAPPLVDGLMPADGTLAAH